MHKLFKTLLYVLVLSFYQGPVRLLAQTGSAPLVPYECYTRDVNGHVLYTVPVFMGSHEDADKYADSFDQAIRSQYGVNPPNAYIAGRSCQAESESKQFVEQAYSGFLQKTRDDGWSIISPNWKPFPPTIGSVVPKYRPEKSAQHKSGVRTQSSTGGIEVSTKAPVQQVSKPETKVKFGCGGCILGTPHCAVPPPGHTCLAK